MTLTIIGRERKGGPRLREVVLLPDDPVAQEQLLMQEAERFGSSRRGDYKENVRLFHEKLAKARHNYADLERAAELCRQIENNLRQSAVKNSLIQGPINPTSLLDLMEMGERREPR